jgi:hypothetical protein
MALKYGFDIDVIIRLSNGLTKLSFDRVLKTKNGFLSGLRLNLVLIKEAGNFIYNKKADVKFDISYHHKIIGHYEKKH